MKCRCYTMVGGEDGAPVARVYCILMAGHGSDWHSNGSLRWKKPASGPMKEVREIGPVTDAAFKGPSFVQSLISRKVPQRTES